MSVIDAALTRHIGDGGSDRGRPLLSAWLRADRAFGRIPHASLIGDEEGRKRHALLGSVRIWARADLAEHVWAQGEVETRRHRVRIGPFGDLTVSRLRGRHHYREFLGQFRPRRIA